MMNFPRTTRTTKSDFEAAPSNIHRNSKFIEVKLHVICGKKTFQIDSIRMCLCLCVFLVQHESASPSSNLKVFLAAVGTKATERERKTKRRNPTESIGSMLRAHTLPN